MTGDTNPMNDIMAADEKIDELPDIGVMDCYVRAKFMKAMMRHYGSRPDGFDASGFKDAKNALENGGHEMVRTWAITPSRRGILKGWVRREASLNRAEDFTIACFNKLTTAEEYGREKRVETARAWLKDYLSGSMGMPDDRVIRETLKNYVD